MMFQILFVVVMCVVYVSGSSKHVTDFIQTAFPNKELIFSHETYSIISNHYAFKQQMHGIDIEDAGVTVSVKKNTDFESDWEPFHLHDGTVDVQSIHSSSKMQTQSMRLDEEDALDVAWEHLYVHGSLRFEPTAKLSHVVTNADSKRHIQSDLVYAVAIGTEAPYGDWKVSIDALTGSVLKVHSTLKVKDKSKLPVFSRATGHALQEAMWDRKETTAAFLAHEEERRRVSSKHESLQAATTVDGLTNLFLPDPITALTDASLRTGDANSAFNDAYVESILKDITQEDNGDVVLDGPYCEIRDIGAPARAPPTFPDTSNQNLDRKDGDFLDTMVYYHIDTAQRYIQSLGFDNIQNNPINADAHGASGEDNSFYSPSTNTIEFGAGCVDDAEDATVIWHEYGHAMMAAVSDTYMGYDGDVGAIGEGWSDYWAGSYKYTQANGADFKTERVFLWDGTCWGGRGMNLTTAKYNKDIIYTAHDNLHYGDELWSTPTFQAMLELVEQHGIERTLVDQIMIEALFYFQTKGPTMRELALVVVDTALELSDDDIVAWVLYAKFAQIDILTDADHPFPESDLGNGVPITISGSLDSVQYFSIPSSFLASNVKITLSGGTGDADLYARIDGLPTTTYYSNSSTGGSTNEEHMFLGNNLFFYDRYIYVAVHAYTPFSDATLTVSWSDLPVTDIGLLEAGGTFTEAINVVAQYNVLIYTLEVEEASSFFEISVDGSNGDIDLYVNPDIPGFGEQVALYYAISFSSVESVTINGPGLYYIILFAWQTSTNIDVAITRLDTNAKLSEWNVVDALGQDGIDVFQDDSEFYAVYVPPGVTNLTVMCTGPNGDLDMYLYRPFPALEAGYWWNEVNADFFYRTSENYDTWEIFMVEDPPPGFYAIHLYGYYTATNAELQVSLGNFSSEEYVYDQEFSLIVYDEITQDDLDTLQEDLLAAYTLEDESRLTVTSTNTGDYNVIVVTIAASNTWEQNGAVALESMFESVEVGDVMVAGGVTTEVGVYCDFDGLYYSTADECVDDSGTSDPGGGSNNSNNDDTVAIVLGIIGGLVFIGVVYFTYTKLRKSDDAADRVTPASTELQEKLHHVDPSPGQVRKDGPVTLQYDDEGI